IPTMLRPARRSSPTWAHPVDLSRSSSRLLLETDEQRHNRWLARSLLIFAAAGDHPLCFLPLSERYKISKYNMCFSFFDVKTCRSPIADSAIICRVVGD